MGRSRGFQSSVGRLDLAIEAKKRGLVLAPNSTFISAELAYLEFLDGWIDDSKANVQAAFARGLDNSPLHQTLFEIAYYQHDANALQQQMTWFHEKGGEADWEHAQGDLDASQGKMRSAISTGDAKPICRRTMESNQCSKVSAMYPNWKPNWEM
jgi:hypothetical protein